MSWKDDTWRGERDNGDRWEASWEDSGAGWILRITWTRHFDVPGVLGGTDVAVDQTVGCFSDKEAEKTSAMLDGHDDMEGWEDGNGHAVSWDTAAEEVYTPCIWGKPPGPLAVWIFGERDSSIQDLTATIEYHMTESDCLRDLLRDENDRKASDEYDGFCDIFDVDDWSVKRYAYYLYSDVVGTKACVRYYFDDKRWQAFDNRPEDEEYWASMYAMDTTLANMIEIEIVTYLGERFLFAGSTAEGQIFHITRKSAPAEVSGTGKIVYTGHSLAILVTKEAKILGVDRDDVVAYTLKRTD